MYHYGSIECCQIQPPSRVRMLQVRRVQEFKYCLKCELGSHEGEGRWAFWNREQEDISLFVRCLWVITPVETVLDQVHSVEGTQGFGVLDFCLSRFFIPQEFLKPDNRTLKLNILLFGLIIDGLALVDQDEDERLCCLEVFGDVGEEGGVAVDVKQVQKFLTGEDLSLGVEDFEVVHIQDFHYFIHL